MDFPTTLFPLKPTDNFADTLADYAENEVYDDFGERIYQRAVTYYNAGLVSVTRIVPGRIEGVAAGTRAYKLSLEWNAQNVIGSCSCPYDDACKHLAAFIWMIDDLKAEELAVFARPEKSDNNFNEHLDSLTREELTTLVQQFAPPEYREKIRLQGADATTRKLAYRQAANRVAALFSTHFYPGSIEEDLREVLVPLRNFWDTHAGVIDLYAGLLRQANVAAEQNRFEIDDEDRFYPEAWCTETAAYVSTRPADKRQMVAEIMLDAALFASMLDMSDYPEHLLDAAREHNALKEIGPVLLSAECMRLCDQQVAASLFNALRESQPYEARVAALANLYRVDYTQLHALAQEAIDIGNPGQALLLLSEYLGKLESGGRFYSGDLGACFELLIELFSGYQPAGQATDINWAHRYVDCLPTANTLQYVVNRYPDQAAAFESAVRKHNPKQYAKYLENADRLTDILPLLEYGAEDSVPPDWGIKFYTRHETLFPDLAATYAQAHIAANEEFAKRSAYEEIVRGVELLQLASPVAARQELARLRLIYRRRGALMGMLNLLG